MAEGERHYNAVDVVSAAFGTHKAEGDLREWNSPMAVWALQKSFSGEVPLRVEYPGWSWWARRLRELADDLEGTS